MQAWAPQVDVSETDQEYHIEADLPVRQEDIEIQVQDGAARSARPDAAGEPPQGAQEPAAQGQASDGQAAGQGGQAQGQPQQAQPRQYHQRERRFGYFERVMALPPDEQNIRAEFRDGVLTLRLPKMQPAGQQGRRIPIGGGQSAASEERPGRRRQARSGGRRTDDPERVGSSEQDAGGRGRRDRSLLPRGRVGEISANQLARNWWALVLQGIAGVVTGVVIAFVAPLAAAVALLYLMAAWALVTGAMEIAAAIRLPKEIENSGCWA